MEDLAKRIANLSPEKRLLLELQLQKKKGLPEPIAIVGMGCRLPGANSLQAYWQLLLNERDSVREVPSDRWDIERFYDRDPSKPGKTYCRWGGFLDNVDQFDPEFFGIAPREAAYIDPQQRLFLEVIWEALEDAGLIPQDLAGSQTGVFAGASTLDYGQTLLRDADVVDTYTATGLASTMVANRVSYLLNFQGPSLTVDTACSSSLVAVHLACQSLWQGESTLALAGGVNLILTPALTVGFSKLTALSPDGRCKAFDASANGFVRSEGAGVIVLKRLSQALAAGDQIYALIRGGAVNQDGRSNGLTAPNPVAQEAVLTTAYDQAGIPLDQVDYVEAHGTGTLLGDPIEAKALGQVFGRSTERPLRIGSVKTNIGHTESAAGIASLIKLALCLHHRQWVTSLHYQTPNPYIPFEELGLKVQQQGEPLTKSNTIAGVSSFGFGGTNAHTILQGIPALTLEKRQRPQHLLTLSAKSEAALRAQAQQYGDWLRRLTPKTPIATATPLGPFCHTVNRGRTSFEHRLTVQGDDATVMATALQSFAMGQYESDVEVAKVSPVDNPQVVFLFTGQGSQYVGMGRQLFETHPQFRQTLETCDQLLQPYLEDSLLSVIFAEADDNRLHETRYTQPALFAVEYALAQLWQSWGVRPAAVLGHSVGEYVAACIAGVFSLEAGLKLIAQRGKLMQSLPTIGMMAAVFADERTVEKTIRAFGDTVAIATLNGPNNTVIAGRTEDVQQVLSTLSEQGITAKPLKVSHAFHSPLMDPILTLLGHQINQFDLHPPQIPLISNVTGTFVPEGKSLDAAYWQRHTREAVRFADGLTTLHQKGYHHFLEIGPQPTLSAMGRQFITPDTITWLPSLRRKQDNWQTLLTSLSALYLAGVDIDWVNFDKPYGYRRLPLLPTYPFQRQRHWVEVPPLITPTDLPASASIQQTTPSSNPHQDWGYTLQWQPSDLPPASKPVSQQQWLLIGEQTEQQQILSQQLRQQTHRIIQVTAGKSFQQIDNNHYQINLTAPKDYQALFAALPQDMSWGGWIYDAATAQPSLQRSVALTDQAYSTCHPAMVLFQTLQAQSRSTFPTGFPQVWLLTHNTQLVSHPHTVNAALSQPPLNLEQSLLWGLGRVIRYEHPELWGGLVDLETLDSQSDSSQSDSHYGSSLNSDDEPHITQVSATPTSNNQLAQVKTLIEHLQALDGEDEIALRQGQRYTTRLKRHPLEPSPQQANPKTSQNTGQNTGQNTSPNTISSIRPEATYLITGGLGALGIQVSQWLVEQGAKHLVLVSRHPNPQHPTVATWRQAGIDVIVEALDVADGSAVKALINKIRAKGPNLRGVIHAAGRLADGLLAHQTWSQFEQVLQPKVAGSWNLHQATQTCDLDFFILFSSMAALLGSPGQSNYAAANAFLDALAQYRHSQGVTAQSISWGPWADGGMATQTNAPMNLRGLGLIPPNQGLTLLGDLLEGKQQPIPFGIAPIDWAALIQRLPMDIPPIFSDLATHEGLLDPAEQSANQPLNAESHPLLATLLGQPLAQRTTTLTHYLQQQLGQVLGLKGTAPADRPLADLGIDSLMIMELLNACKRDLRLMLYPRELYEHPTLNALGHYLAEEIAITTRPLRGGHSKTAQESVSNDHPTSLPAKAGDWLNNSWLTPSRPLPTPQEKNPGMVFLLSCPRSGSTLLRVMLAGHPQLFCPPELHMLPFATLVDRQTALGDSRLDEGLQRALMELLQQSADTVQSRLQGWLSQNKSIQSIYKKVQTLAQSRLVVDKSPTYSFSLATLKRAEELFENARYIYLTRHPYSVIDSFVRNRMYKLLGLTPDDPYGLAEQVWTESNQNIRTFLEDIPTERQHWLRYEDLVTDPKQNMTDLCEFLEVPFDAAVVNPYAGRRMTDGLRGDSISVDDPNFRQRQQIDASLAQVWKTIQLPQILGPAAQKVAAATQYQLPNAPMGPLANQDSAITAVPPAKAPPMPPLATLTETFVTVRGLELCLCHWGPQTGPTILCLHGILDHGAVWDEIATQWAAAGYHVVAPDLRGHGRSQHTDLANSYQLLDHLADIDALIRDHLTTPLILVGHSMGAVLAATLTSTRPDWVKQLCLVELVVPDNGPDTTVVDQLTTHLNYLAQVPQHQTFGSVTDVAERLQRLTPQISQERARALAERLTQATPEGVQWRWDARLQVRSNFSLGGAVLSRQRFEKLLGQIAVSTTLIYGEQSQFNRPDDRALQDRAMPHAQQHTVEGGHNLPMETPAAVAQCFFSQLPTLVQDSHPPEDTPLKTHE